MLFGSFNSLNKLVNLHLYIILFSNSLIAILKVLLKILQKWDEN